jgi:hypothetical protein
MSLATILMIWFGAMFVGWVFCVGASKDAHSYH